MEAIQKKVCRGPPIRFPPTVWKLIMEFLIGRKIDKFYPQRKALLKQLFDPYGFDIKSRIYGRAAFRLERCTLCNKQVSWAIDFLEEVESRYTDEKLYRSVYKTVFIIHEYHYMMNQTDEYV